MGHAPAFTNDVTGGRRGDEGHDADDRAADGGDARLHVRPVRYVEDHAVVRRIGDRPLFLGNVHAADPDRRDRSFDGVVSLTSDPRPATTHHHPLVDDEGNEWAAFAAAVDDTRRLTREDGDVLVHCTAGISRSSTILATAIAAAEGRRFREAMTDVQAVRPHAVANPALVDLAVTYLAARPIGSASE